MILKRNKSNFGRNTILRIFGPKYDLLILTERGQNDDFSESSGVR